MNASLFTLMTQLEAAENGLEDAQIDLCGALTAHAEAKRNLEFAEARKVDSGVEGKNAEERAARLRLDLGEEYASLAIAEDVLTEARCTFEVAKLEWDLVRYISRLQEQRQTTV